jgi:N-acetylglucosaminyldiphosphoundecaprenol N-acetyl-beta-D-mannosaminyltransferase
MAASLSAIEQFIISGKPHMVVTADASAVVMAQRDSELERIISQADLVTPDSAGVLWAAKRLGLPFPERVSGVDIVSSLCDISARKGYRIFLMGSAPGVTACAAEMLKVRYPGLQIAGTHHGYFTPEESPALVSKIQAAKPDILFVALGIPRQEKWICDNMQDLQVPVSIGVGGTFDVLSGSVKRAPKWMQRHSLEWAYRLWCNPRKISKVMTLPVFVCMVLGLYPKRSHGGR